MSTTHTVLRPFTGASGKRYQSGDPVDASAWPLRDALESQGFIEPIVSVGQSTNRQSANKRGRRSSTEANQEA
jgi:hypothetical protein